MDNNDWGAISFVEARLGRAARGKVGITLAAFEADVRGTARAARAAPLSKGLVRGKS
jgi:hypothetical protein